MNYLINQKRNYIDEYKKIGKERKKLSDDELERQSLEGSTVYERVGASMDSYNRKNKGE
jgi:hypothetical protein